MKKEIPCVICPQSCIIEFDGENIEGFKCKRGEDYVILETTCPQRILTTTMRTVSGNLIPVRSDCAVHKEELLSLVKQLRSVVIEMPTVMGQVVVHNLGMNKVNIISCLMR